MRISRVAMMFALLSSAATALAQSVAAFDGTYASAPPVTTTSRCVVPQPGPLTIKNGAAQFAGGLNGDLVYQGTVTAQGFLTMRNNLGILLSGKVENGKITGGTTNGTCTITYSWQK
jgi:hypothetical protein